MKNFSLKALGALFFAAGLIVAGVAAPAYAAAGTISVSSFTAGTATGFTFSTGSTNATAVGALDLTIFNDTNQPVTFTPVASCATFTACRVTSVKFGSTTWTQEGNQSGKIVSVLGTVAPNSGSQSHIQFSFSGTGLSLSNEAIEVEFATGALTPPNTNGNYTARASVNASSFLTFTAPVTVTGAPSVVIFMRNYSNMDFTRTSQSSVTQTTLTPNSFTRTGYYFTGWATSDSGPVVYQDGDNYSFASSTQLFAVWSSTPPVSSSGSINAGSAADQTLANTGIDSATGISLLAGGLSLALIGAEMFMIARRKRSN